MIKNRLITPDDIIRQLKKLPDITDEEARNLLDPADKQNVPKAVTLLRHLKTASDLLSTTDTEFERHRSAHISFLATFFNLFLTPFIDIGMNLSDQLESLAAYAHIAVALQLEHGSQCLTGPLYADSQAVVKNIFFTVARMQLISEELQFYLLLEGTDRLEGLFGDCRTLDHGRNFDAHQLSEKLAIAAHINTVYERNPDLDRGHRRLDLSKTIGVDHINPATWKGDTRVGGVDLYAVWNAGHEIARNIVRRFFGKDFNFKDIFSPQNHDLLRPNGQYIGVRVIQDNLLTDKTASPMQPEPLTAESGPSTSLPTKKTSGAPLPYGIPSIEEDSVSEASDISIGSEARADNTEIDPSTLPELEELLPPEDPKFSHTFTINGEKVLIESMVSNISPKNWKQVSDRLLRVRGCAIEDLRHSKIDALLDTNNVPDDQFMKNADLVGFLAWIGNHLALTIMEVKGFKTNPRTKHTSHLAAKYSDLASPASSIIVYGQIIKLVASGTPADYWEWGWTFLPPTGTANNMPKKSSKEYLMVNVPSYLVYPLPVNLSSVDNGGEP